MLVKNWMSTNLVIIDTQYAMYDAVQLLKNNNIRMLPVLKNGVLVGVVTDRDLKRACASDAISVHQLEQQDALSRVKVENIMSRDIVTVPFDYTIEETAELLLEHKISGLPVVNSTGDIIGVITQTDIFKALISLTGKGDTGVQFGLRLKDTRNSLKEVDDILRSNGGRVVSILTSYNNVPEGYRNVYLRVSNIDRVRLQLISDELALKGELLYVLDHRDNIRMVY